MNNAEIDVVISGEQQEADGAFDSPEYVLDAATLALLCHERIQAGVELARTPRNVGECGEQHSERDDVEGGHPHDLLFVLSP